MNLDRLEEYPWEYDRNAPPIDPEYEFLSSHKTLDSFEVGGLKFVCPPGVYHPTELGSTRLMYRGLFYELPRFGKRVLEIGTGSGAIGICLAAAGKEVTLIDIDPQAVACAVNNANINRVKVKVLQSDLFNSIGSERYDLVLFNAPLLDKPVEQPIETIACDPDGELFARFMQKVPSHLTANGVAVVCVSNLGNREAILKALAPFNYRILISEYYGADRYWKCLLAAKPV